MDRVIELPDIAFEMILQRLPLLDAVRTSILSKKWRYKWAMLPKLSLDCEFFDSMYGEYQRPSEMAYPSLVKTVLLQHTGPLHKFVIYIPDLDPPRIEDINLTIHDALMSGVRELTVFKAASIPHALPSSVFSCAEQLTKLKLTDCLFNPPPEVKGFRNLETLDLTSVCSNLERLSSFISGCPKLRRIALTELDNSDQHLCIHAPSVEVFSIEGCFGSVLLLEVQNLVSLKIYLLEMSKDYEKAMPYNDYMVQLFSSLSKIKYLELGDYICRLLGADCVPRKLSTEFENLKTIKVVSLDLRHAREFHCLLTLIRSSPNLEQVEIAACRDEDTSEEPSFLPDAGNCSDYCFHCLRTVKISKLMGTKGELKMIEILLSHSPVLQVICIEVESKIDKAAKLELSQELMRFSRASHVAQVLCTYDEEESEGSYDEEESEGSYDEEESEEAMEEQPPQLPQQLADNGGPSQSLATIALQVSQLLTGYDRLIERFDNLEAMTRSQLEMMRHMYYGFQRFGYLRPSPGWQPSRYRHFGHPQPPPGWQPPSYRQFGYPQPSPGWQPPGCRHFGYPQPAPGWQPPGYQHFGYSQPPLGWQPPGYWHFGYPQPPLGWWGTSYQHFGYPQAPPGWQPPN